MKPPASAARFRGMSHFFIKAAVLPGILFALGTAALAETRESLSRIIPDSRSQSYDDARLRTPKLPGETNDREPMLDLTGDLGNPFEELFSRRGTINRRETTTTRRITVRPQNRGVIERRR